MVHLSLHFIRVHILIKMEEHKGDLNGKGLKLSKHQTSKNVRIYTMDDSSDEESKGEPLTLKKHSTDIVIENLDNDAVKRPTAKKS